MSSLIYKRPGSPYWYVAKTRQSTKTANKKLAEEFAKKALTEHWRDNVLGAKTHLWTELAADWLDKKSGTASYGNDELVIRRFTELLARRKVQDLTDVTGDIVSEYGKAAKAASTAATANRHLNTIRAMLRRAEYKGWISKAPRVEAYEVVSAEANWLTPEQAASIIPHLPEWVADMYVFAQQTGLRYSNVAGFKWAWLVPGDAVAFVPAVNAKTKRTYTVPLSDKAREIVAKLRVGQKDQTYVFVGKKRVGRQFYKGKRERTEGVYVDCAPVESVRYWWERATEAAGLDVTWHQGTRHTWATMHTKRRTPDRILAKMGGWASTKMLARYGHHDADDLIEYANNLNRETK